MTRNNGICCLAMVAKQYGYLGRCREPYGKEKK